MGKKLLSILLTLAMLLSMIPAGFAADIEIVEDETAKESPVSDEDRVDVTADEEYYETSLPNDDIMLIETDDDITIDPDRETRQILTAIPASDDPEYDPAVISFLFYPDADSDQYVDLTDFSGTLTVDFNEEPIPYKFVITMDHPEQISYLCVVSYTEETMRQLTAEYDAASGTFITEGFFDEEDPYYQPQNVSLEYTVRSTAPEVGSDLDWDEIAANLGEALSNSTVESTQSDGVTSGAIDFSKTTEDLSKLLLNYTIKEFDANCGTELAAARSYYKTGSKILAYVVPGINDSKYYVYLDYSDPNTYKMFLDDGLDVAGKAIELEMQFLDSDSQQFLALENASEFISNASTISSVVGKTYHICQETERLRQQVEQSVTIENRDEALRKVDELHDNKMGFMLLTTALPIIVAGAGVMGPAPAMLFSGIIGVMSAVSNAIYDYRVGGIIGKEVETSWYPNVGHESGKCGENLTYEWIIWYDEFLPSCPERTRLIISGTGATYDYEYVSNVLGGWGYMNREFLYDRCEKITVQEGVTDLTAHIFGGFSYYEDNLEVSLPNSLRSIGEGAFSGCERLKSIDIPAGVTSIGDSAFYGCSSLTDITIPEGVQRIGHYAFAYCRSLERISLPQSLVYLGGWAFINTAITELRIPPNVEAVSEDEVYVPIDDTSYHIYDYKREPLFGSNIQKIIFEEGREKIPDWFCTQAEKLTQVIIPEGVTAIGDYAFSFCDSLTSVEIPSGVTSIGANAFSESGLTNMIIPEGVTSIGEKAFSVCWGLNSITIPGSVTSVGPDAFFNCEKLITAGPIGDGYNIEFGWSDAIPSFAFSNCHSLTDVTIPESVISIGEKAFCQCDNLTNVTIPGHVTSIGSFAFYSCDSLTGVTIPSSVTDIGYMVFSCCKSLAEIQVSENNNYYRSVEGVLLSKDGRTLSCFPCGKSGEYLIPKTVKYVASNAFYNCDSLTSVIIPTSVESILSDSFYDCDAITEMVFPKNVKYIGSFAFKSCDSLKKITIVNCENGINVKAFADCGRLSEIYFSGSAPKEINNYCYDCFNNVTATAYYPENDESWTEEVRQNFGGTITWVPYTPDPPEPEVIADGHGGDDLTGTQDDEGTLTVSGAGPMWDFEWNEDESVTTAPWAGYIDQIKTLVLSDGVTSVGNEAFDGFENLTDVRLGNTVARLGEYSFQNIGVSSLHIPASVVDISVCAIYLCSNLEEITVDEANPAYRSVDGVLFTEDMSVLVSYPIARNGPYTVPQGVKSIGNGAFQSCRGLTEIVFSEGLTSIQNYAFLGTGLTKLVLPEGVTEIGAYSFASCQSMTSAVLPQSLTVIAERAFQSCTALEDLTVSNSLERIEAYAFCNCSSLKSFVVPDSLTEFEPGAVSGCASLVAFIVSAGNTSFCAIDGVLFTKDRRELVQYPAGKTDSSYSVPDGTERIRWGSFFRSRNLTEVGLPAGLQEIDDWAFEACSNMSEISFPKDLQRIGYAAFSDCQGLTSITLPEGLGQLDEWAFGDCENIESVIILEGLTEIGGAAFYSCDSLSSVRLPASLRTIKSWAFGHCPKLKDVVLPEGLVSMEDLAFYGCEALTEIIIPGSVTEIGSWVFGWSGLSEIRFLGAAPVIGDDCFQNVTATAYYPEDNGSWTEDVRKDYGGTITWVSYQNPDDDESIVTDYTKGVATTSLEPGTSYSGETSFTVSSTGDKAVVVAVKRGDSYTLLKCTTDENGVHHFTADLDEDTEIVIALKGDANLDGKVTTTDGTMIKRAAMGTYSYDSELKTLVSDVNGDGNVRTTEGTMISRAAMGTYTLPW